MTHEEIPKFNLWNDPWIGVENHTGAIETVNLYDAITRAHELTALYDPSPLVVVGIHRLLTAIIQNVLAPAKTNDLEAIWTAGVFDKRAFENFGNQYGFRFELFTETTPFLQSEDLTLHPSKGDDLKTVAYLMPDIPSGTEITHYHHGAEDNQSFCPVCAAKGLVIIPAFATSGGATIKPSINGAPPLYIIPGGKNLFESLAASLLLPVFQPQVSSGIQDHPWWDRPAIVKRSAEVIEVGYLASLTFPARRVRLHPVHNISVCTRCGKETTWAVRTMIFEMGECRPKDAPVWFDPFAAYRLPEKDGEKPIPIQPSASKAVWREFAGLFLGHASGSQNNKNNNKAVQRPRVLDQISSLFLDDEDQVGPAVNERNFRCIGMRTKKAKVFEWIDTGFDVPDKLLREHELAGHEVDCAIDFANKCASIILDAFKKIAANNKKNSDRFAVVRNRMLDQFWLQLSPPFRVFVMNLDPDHPDNTQIVWIEEIVHTAYTVFRDAIEMLPNDAASLRKRIEGETMCSILLAGLKKKELNHE